MILASYIGSFLMAGGFLAIGAALSALTKNQVIAFVRDRRPVLSLHRGRLAFVLGFFRAGRRRLSDAVASFSFLAHFNAHHPRRHRSARRRVLPVGHDRAFLFANAILVDLKKAD